MREKGAYGYIVWNLGACFGLLCHLCNPLTWKITPIATKIPSANHLTHCAIRHIQLNESAHPTNDPLGIVQLSLRFGWKNGASSRNQTSLRTLFPSSHLETSQCRSRAMQPSVDYHICSLSAETHAHDQAYSEAGQLHYAMNQSRIMRRYGT